MSVVCENRHGWILDHEQFWNKSYRVNKSLSPKEMSKDVGQLTRNLKNEKKSNSCELGKEDNSTLICEKLGASDKLPNQINYDQDSSHTCRNKKGTQLSNPSKGDNSYVTVNTELFSIHQPFQMDSQFDKYAMKILENVNECEKRVDNDNLHVENSQPSKAEMRRQRKRKKKSDAIPRHIKELADHLTDALRSLLKIRTDCGHFKDKSSLPLNNNTSARNACKNDSDDMALRVPIAEELLLQPTRGCLEESESYSFLHLCHRLYSQEGESPVIITADQEQYLIPASSTFYMSHTDQLNSFISALDGRLFDLIVMDPPWENKSVKRKKMYYTLPDCDIKELPVISLANEGCLIVTWVTNKQKHEDYVREILFPHWSVQYLTKWHWLKVTVGGEPVTEMLSEGKKPYECVILGRYCPTTSADTDIKLKEPNNDRVIVSIPCILHSKKPPLQEILAPYCVANPDCLELFARNLTPGWTSWGNEVLRHQNLKLYNITSRKGR